MRAESNPNPNKYTWSYQKILKIYEGTIEKTTTTQNYRKQIHNLDKEFNCSPKNATEIVIFEK